MVLEGLSMNILRLTFSLIITNDNGTWYRNLPFSPTNGKDHVNTSMKLGSQYGCGEQLNCRMFITLFSYFSTAAWKPQNSRTTCK
jgi:hypothetical protein